MARRSTVTAAEHGQALARVAELEAELGALRAREHDTALSLATMNATESPLDRSLRGLLLELLRTLHRPGVSGRHGFLWVRDGALVPHGDFIDMNDPSVPQEVIDRIHAWVMEPWPLTPDLTVGLAALERRTVTVADLAGPEGAAFPATQMRLARQRELGGALRRSHIATPVLVDGEAAAVVHVSRLVVEPFTADEIAVVERIAEQMALAIGNARLTERLEERTRDLAEALEHQRATGEVLEIISRSPANVQGVLDAICERGVRLLGAQNAAIQHFSGGSVAYVAGYRDGEPTGARLDQPTATGARVRPALVAATERRTIHLSGGPNAIAGEFPETAAMWRERGINALLATPLVTREDVFGALVVTRATPEPFTAAEQELIQSFAGQAVIAIENSRLFEALEQRNRDLTETLERERATSNLLRVISQSPGELQPVFDAIAEATGRICEADDAGITALDGERFREPRANYIINEGMALRPHDWVSPPVDRGSSNGRAVIDRRPSHVWGEPEDVEAEYPRTAQLMRERGLRAIVSVPLLKNGEPAGMVWARRSRPRPFSDAQIALLETFADQAVIAIENARLFREIQDKTYALEAANTGLREALERQTATSEVLAIISSSPANLTLVFDAIAERAARLCGADIAANGIWLVDGDEIVSSTSGDFFGQRRPLTAGMVVAHALREGRTVAIGDLTGPEGDPYPNARASLVPLGRRSIVSVPMTKDGRAIGAITISRSQPLAFTDGQIELLETFADQAVIAVENARLIGALQESNTTLRESLEQQTATGEVLEVISSSPADLRAVLHFVAEQAARICDANDAVVYRVDGDAMWTEAQVGDFTHLWPVGERRSWTENLARGRSNLTVAITERHTVHIPNVDVAAAEYPVSYTAAMRVGSRASLTVPILHEGRPLGAIMIRRFEAKPFTERQITMLETFASQAAIAVENARLFTQLQDSNASMTRALDQQRAVSGVLEAISRAPTDVQAALVAIVEAARTLAGAATSAIYERVGNQFRLTPLAMANPLITPPTDAPVVWRPVASTGPIGEAIAEGRTARWHGTLEQMRERYPAAAEFISSVGFTYARTMVAAPLFHGDEVTGAQLVVREPDRDFTAEEVALVETFASQAAIAIQNARLFTQLQDSNTTLREALEREQATAEVLEIVSRSPADLDEVLSAILQRSLKLCNSARGAVHLMQDGLLVSGVVNTSGNPPAGPRPLGPELGAPATAILERHIVNFAGTVEEFEQRYPGNTFHRDRGRTAITVLAVPLLRDGAAIGAVSINRDWAEPYTAAQIALVETFAGQAVIAIENARLFQEIQDASRELEVANTDLTDALTQQTAISDVLRGISRSAFDLKAVLNTLVETAARLCDAEFGGIARRGHGPEAVYGASDEYRELLLSGALSRYSLPEDSGPTHYSPLTTMWQERRTVHVPDIFAVPEYQLPEETRPYRHATWLAVPLLRDGEVVGNFRLSRTEVRPFTERQIKLVETFADQAVIAIENARLFEEIQVRTTELEHSNATLREALDQQTTTADVLRIISSAPADLKRVATALVQSAAKLLGSDNVQIVRIRDGGRERIAQTRVDLPFALPSPEWSPIAAGTMLEQAVRERRMVYFSGTDEEFRAAFPGAPPAIHADDGTTVNLIVPMLRGEEVIGTFFIGRPGRPLSDREIALVQSFADQATIAFENARLFQEIQDKSRELEQRNREVTDSLERQTATSEVLGIIAASPNLAEPVFQAIVERAARLVDAPFSHIMLVEGEMIRTVASFPAGSIESLLPLSSAASAGAEVVLSRHTRHVWGEPDEIEAEHPVVAALWRRPGNTTRSAVTVPLLRGGQGIGALSVRRSTSVPFTPQQIALLETFADQAVIALENARLFDEIQQRTRELEAASRAKSEFLSRMSHELRTPLNAIIGFGEIMEMDPATTRRQHERVRHILQGGRHLLGLINEVLDITRIEAGRLSLSLEPVRLDTVVQEVLDLERPLAADAGVRLLLDDPAALRVAVQADRQRLRQIVLNLVANAIKYNREDGAVTLRISRAPDSAPPCIRLTVVDTGPGIPAEQLDRLFAPFERLSADGSGVEGTGLGLAIARGLAEAMGGAIGVASVAGEGSEFWVELPEAVVIPPLPSAGDLAGAGSDGAEDEHIATILYIEDNQPNVELVQHALEFRPGVTLLTAPDGATGLRLAMRYQPNLILLDLNLPDLNGDEVLARLRADSRTATIPAVMVSADATPGQVVRLLAAGARAYLTKPLDVRRFLRLIDDVIAERG